MFVFEQLEMERLKQLRQDEYMARVLQGQNMNGANLLPEPPVPPIGFPVYADLPADQIYQLTKLFDWPPERWPTPELAMHNVRAQRPIDTPRNVDLLNLNQPPALGWCVQCGRYASMSNRMIRNRARHLRKCIYCILDNFHREYPEDGYDPPNMT